MTHKDGPLLIVAGAGTGKTTVITQRIAYLIEQGRARSDEILALTFTEKAAGEMEERVDRLLPIGYLDLWVSTFHSFGERILVEHGLDIGLPFDFKLLNEFEQWALIRKNLDKFNLNYYRPLGNPTKFIHALVKHFSRVKDEDISPDEYLKYAEELKENMDSMLSGGGKRRNSKLQILSLTDGVNSSGSSRQPAQGGLPKDDRRTKEMAEQEVARINEVANAYHVYQQLLLNNNALDFGDLINYCLKLFRQRPAILEKYRQQFKYILLDEFQDTNWAQYELVKMLAAPKNNLVVVGDDDQSIYKFRGASVSNILQFKKDYPKSKEIALVKNYRNKQNILDLSYEFIKLNNPNRLEYQLNKGQKNDRMAQSGKAAKQRLDKKLVAKNKGEGAIGVIAGKDLADEVRQVVEKIADLKVRSQRRVTNAAHANRNNEEASWNDYAILVRANESAKNFCQALEIAGLPYQFLASRGLYTKPVIMDILAYLKMLDNYHESPSLYRVLNLPVLNFSYQELVNFNYWANKKAWSLYEVLKSANSFNLGRELLAKVEIVLNLIAKHTALVREKSVLEVVLAFLNDSGYLKYLSSRDEHISREIIGYLNQFLKRIQSFESGSDDKSVNSFLSELNMEIDSGEEGALLPDIEAGPEAIKIMTVHAAKGLEFKYVFIANLVDKRFPTIERKELIQIPDALIKEILPQGDIHLEEERRLFYVAMTRAKQDLYFSWAPDYGGIRRKKPSRFLAESGMVQGDNLPAQAGKTEKLKNTETEEAEAGILDFSIVKKKNENGPARYPVPSYFSYTQLAAFSNCPYQYRFAHILKIPRQGKAQFSFGKTMHSTLQKLFELIKEKRGLDQTDLFNQNKEENKGKENKVEISIEEILDLYKQSWIEDWYESNERKEEYRKLGKEILRDFYKKYEGNWPLVLFTEKGFNIKIFAGSKSYTIRGAIDRIDEAGGKLKVIDYKTGRPKEKLNFIDKEQLLIYQMAARDLFAQEIDSLSFYFLENNTELEFLGTDSELKKVKEKIITTIREIEKNKFPPKPSSLCRYCDFYDICEFRKA